MSLGIDQNNPMNLRWHRDIEWYGRVDDRDVSEPSYEMFHHAIFGIRAGVKNLIVGYFADGLNTPRSIIERYAPPSDDNPTEQYIRFVAVRMGVREDEAIGQDRDSLGKLAGVIIEFENGQNPYPEWLIDMAVVLAMTT